MKVDPLRVAHQELRKAVGPARRKAKATDGKLATAWMEALQMWDQMKTNGGTMAEFTKGLEHVIRESWPQSDEACRCPRCRWLCQRCEDTGALHELRPARLYGGLKVNVVVPCTCAKGCYFRPGVKQHEDFTAAARSKPTRVGRS